MKLCNSHFPETLPEADVKYNIRREQLYCYCIPICSVIDTAAFWESDRRLDMQASLSACSRKANMDRERPFYARLI